MHGLRIDRRSRLCLEDNYMINIMEVTETNDMIEKEMLDVRTITMGISL